MSKKQIIILISFCVLLACLFIGALAGTAALFLLGNTQGLIGELLADVEIPPLFEKLPPEEETSIEAETQEAETEGDVIEVYPLPLETAPVVTVEPDLEEFITLPEEMLAYFDFDMEQIPANSYFSRVHKGMRLALVINIMGKPHRYIHLTDESVTLLWKTDTEESITVNVSFQPGEYENEEDRWNHAIVTDVTR